MNPFTVVAQFESALCAYTGARYAVTVNSCTMALLLACRFWYLNGLAGKTVEVPARTYVGVGMSVIHAGFKVRFVDRRWRGAYGLKPLQVFDCARRFTSDMYVARTMQCVSFHPTKILGLSGYGGAILHDHHYADEWLRRARFDGRTEGVHPKDDPISMIGYHCYMSPPTAAEGLLRLSTLPAHNVDLDNDDYCDLRELEAFK